ncbi:MAG: M1 family metallopeptidase [Thermoanaerobaculia bacterium]
MRLRRPTFAARALTGVLSLAAVAALHLPGAAARPQEAAETPRTGEAGAGEEPGRAAEPGAAGAGAAADVSALSPRNADYTIQVRLDPAQRRLEGRQRLVWRNVQDVSTDELRFHLYWNAWRNDRSTWMIEERLGGDLASDVPEDAWGWTELDSIRVSRPGGGGGEEGPDDAVAGEDAGEDGPEPVPAGPADLTEEARFDAPDDGNPWDRTVLVVPLPAPVGPGETVAVEMDWRSRVPRTFARTGVRGDFYFIAHWFPKLGVFEGEDGWACHQYHANTEYYSDYGAYDVEITTPEGWVVGATGRRVEDGPTLLEGGGRGTTRRFVQEDVHGFAWTASPDYLEATDRFEAPGLPPVDLRLLYQPEHAHQVKRHFAATKATLQRYGTWYGAYPYEQLTVVDPAWESGAGGMEYPTFFTAGTRIFNPPLGGSPEGVTIHEAGHQFWYGIVGNDEFEHAWLDEGLNTFSTARVYEEAYGEEALVERYLRPPGTGWRGFLPAVFPEIRSPREVEGIRLDHYRRNPSRDVPATPTWQYYPETHGTISYSKVATWLMTLERHLGWETLQEILSTFFERWKFRHPEAEDFFAVANEVARARRGVDLDWFFQQVHYDDVVFDYAIEKAVSRPAAVEGLVEDQEVDGFAYRRPGPGGEAAGAGDEQAGGGTGREDAYRTEVVARRLGQGVFPVEVVLVFEDGEEDRRLWDGRSRWELFVHEGPSKLEYAVVDPDRTLLLDLDYTNNSRLREEASWLAAAQWAGKWSAWLQEILQAMTFFV